MDFLRLFNLRKKTRREIIINAESLETRAAIMVDGKLDEFYVERTGEDRIVGSIYKGRIQNTEDALQAAFVDIGLKKNAFVHYWDMIPEDAARLAEDDEEEQAKRDANRGGNGKGKKQPPSAMAKRFPPGTEILVQVTKAPISTKGPRVTTNITIPGRHLVLLPGSKLKGVSRKIGDDAERARLKKTLSRLPIPEDAGCILRSAGAGVRNVSIVRDLRTLLDTWNRVKEGWETQPAPCCLYREPDLIERIVRDSLTDDIDRIVVDDREAYDRIKEMVARISRRMKNRIRLYDGAVPIFEQFDAERQLENVYRRKVWLKSGGYLYFDETEALVAVDVNTGRSKSVGSQEDNILACNLEAAQEIARQARLRNIGGLIVIDFIDMKSRKNQNTLFQAFKAAVARDTARTNILPVSALGLIEMTRQRVEGSVSSATYSNCPYCRGRGKVLSGLSMSVRIQRRIQAIVKRDGAAAMTLRIVVNPLVMDRLRKEDEQVLIDLERKTKAQLTFVSDANLHIEDFRVLNGETGAVLYDASGE
jgi:ribonuclease G